MTDRESYNTDWLANSVYGFGFGYTPEQALSAMVRNVKPVDVATEVHLVEHYGHAKVSASGWDVEEFVSGEVIEVEPDEWNCLRDHAIDCHAMAETVTDSAERVRDLDGEEGEEE